MKRRVEQLSKSGKIINTFDSIADAARHIGFNESAIRKGLDNPFKKVGGYFWVSSEEQSEYITKNYSTGVGMVDLGCLGQPKILILDIETAPLLTYVFQKQVWKARISSDKVISDWFMLTWSAKWLNDITIYSERLSMTEAVEEDDYRIVSKLWHMVNEADIIVAHNGDSFDIPNMNTRFIYHDLGAPSYYKTIDTLKIAQRQFGFTHNNLDGLAQFFGMDGKIETTFSLWKRCMRGEVSALKEMEEYNRQDVLVLEQVYLKLKPWIKSHANYSLYNDDEERQCSHCGHTKLTGNGYYYTNTGKYRVFRCDKCGASSRERNTVLSRKKNILVSIPGR